MYLLGRGIPFTAIDTSVYTTGIVLCKPHFVCEHPSGFGCWSYRLFVVPPFGVPPSVRSSAFRRSGSMIQTDRLKAELQTKRLKAELQTKRLKAELRTKRLKAELRNDRLKAELRNGRSTKDFRRFLENTDENE